MKQFNRGYFFIVFLTGSILLLVSSFHLCAEEIIQRDAKGMHGMVASAHPKASQVGVEILKNGGNAIDAAVAVGFSLGVLEPNASGIGGGGFMLIRLAKNGETIFVDFREKAPEKATEGMFKLDSYGKQILDGRGFKPSAIGGRAVAVPGEVAGLLSVLERYGSMNRQQVLLPAIRQAERGITVSAVLSDLIAGHYAALVSFPASEQVYLSDGFPKMEGEIIVNADLANTMKQIVEHGRDGFYRGPVARKIVAAVQSDGGILSMKDLAGYEVKYRQPVTGNYRGYEIFSAPPPSSGGTHVIELLNIMEQFDLRGVGLNSTNSLHAWAEAMKLVFADRAEFMADMDFVEVPLRTLTSKEYAHTRFNVINMGKASKVQVAGSPRLNESGSTTHFSVIDADGNMVACTKTINHFFGSGLTAPGTGVLLNDEMDDFNKRTGQANSVAAGKKPLSSMSPTLLLKDGVSFASLGTPGGKRIIPTVALLISNLIDHQLDIQAAIEAPRIANYEQGSLKMEGRIPVEIQSALKVRGHNLDVRKDYDLFFGGAQGIVIDQKSGELHGGADPRRGGQAMGY